MLKRIADGPSKAREWLWAQTEEGWTPLSLARSQGHRNLVVFLQKHRTLKALNRQRPVTAPDIKSPPMGRAPRRAETAPTPGKRGKQSPGGAGKQSPGGASGASPKEAAGEPPGMAWRARHLGEEEGGEEEGSFRAQMRADVIMNKATNLRDHHKASFDLMA